MHARRLPSPEERLRANFARAAVLLSYISCREEKAKFSGTELAKDDIALPPKPDSALPAIGRLDRSPRSLPGACPDGMAEHSNFCMDRFEGRLVYIEDGRPHPHFLRPVDFTKVRARSDFGAFPQGYLSQLESATVCSNAGKRLCTLREWMEACTAGGKRRFPYGEGARGNICNSGKGPHVMSLYHGGNHPGHYWDNNQFNDPILNVTHGYLARTGMHPECVSERGESDLTGNLHEWVSDVGENGMGTFAGSCYSDNDMPCSYYAQVHARQYHDYSTGVRCCSGKEGKNEKNRVH
ncbi:MAG TPA: SUMF1/EgtB/PvdO family nonheme iron enzyme [Candidatus Bilamarchaeum sp.]|nr:SUMF1/EgtB/PvdO family nonheme iron enzyme [Candidatus Bilamarchaeum sp.]